MIRANLSGIEVGDTVKHSVAKNGVGTVIRIHGNNATVRWDGADTAALLNVLRSVVVEDELPVSGQARAALLHLAAPVPAADAADVAAWLELGRGLAMSWQQRLHAAESILAK